MKFIKLGYKDYTMVYGTDETGTAATQMARFAMAHAKAQRGVVGVNGNAYALPMLSGAASRKEKFATLRLALADMDKAVRHNPEMKPFMLPRLGCGSGGYTDYEMWSLIRSMQEDHFLANVTVPGIWQKDTKTVWLSPYVDVLDPVQFRQLVAMQPTALLFVDDDEFNKDALRAVAGLLAVDVFKVKLGKAYTLEDHYAFAAWASSAMLVPKDEFLDEHSAMVEAAKKGNVPITVMS